MKNPSFLGKSCEYCNQQITETRVDGVWIPELHTPPLDCIKTLLTRIENVEWDVLEHDHD